MLAEGLDVAHLEAGPLHRQHALADVDQLAVGEDVAVDERRPSELEPADRADGVVEQPPLGPQRTAQDVEVPVEVALTDVLEHADRGDRVERLAAEPR